MRFLDKLEMTSSFLLNFRATSARLTEHPVESADRSPTELQAARLYDVEGFGPSDRYENSKTIETVVVPALRGTTVGVVRAMYTG